MALQFVNQTSQHIFLTGKAGTGKTTFLKHVKEQSAKNLVIVAPTGVAAINAGGVTMHSFFQLPFGPFIPNGQRGWGDGDERNFGIATPQTIFKNIRFNKAKLELVQELELLVIDEVSMLRADMLDAVDLILRHFRRQPLMPFGGVQVLYIGDLFQLPPVVKNEEWEILKPTYKSPYFFDALVLQQAAPVYLELKKIYRQNEAGFINLLNKIRNNCSEAEDLELLHSRYDPHFRPPDSERYIILTTHNAKVDLINRRELARLPGESYSFEASIEKEFNEKALPAEKILQLKAGAQIMFLKNDKGEFRRYYNGKIGIISRLDENEIYVEFPNEPGELLLEKETWLNIRYHYNKERGTIEEEELGKFIQYPIRLAWAITIHKSQGLTFQKAIIDAGESFAPGQVYVALSRLVSIDGLVLYSKIQPHCIQTDERVLQFAHAEISTLELQQQLSIEQKNFITYSLIRSFDCTKIVEKFREFNEDYEDRLIPDKGIAVGWFEQLLDKLIQQEELGSRFKLQLEELLPMAPDDRYKSLQQRVSAATDYFTKALDECIASIRQHVKEFRAKQRVKTYLKDLSHLDSLLMRKKQELAKARKMAEELQDGRNPTEILSGTVEADKQKQTALSINQMPRAPKLRKGETFRLSLDLFKAGKSIVDIAALRSLSPSTIEAHLVTFIATGEIKLSELVSAKKIESLLKVIDELGPVPLARIKEKLGDAFAYSEIRASMMHWKLMRQAAEKE
jgi:hypothetical protein